MVANRDLAGRGVSLAALRVPVLPAGILGWFAVLLGVLLMLRPPLDPDLGWHLRTGQLILATRQVPHSDPYSYTVPGAPWIDQEWLWQVAAAWLYDLAGMPGVALLGSLIVGAVVALVYTTLRLRGTSAGIAAAGALLALLNLAPAAHVRPALTAALFCAAYLLIYELYRHRPGWWWLAALIPLQLLWANVHASYILGPVLCATFGIVQAWQRSERKALSWDAARHLLRPWGGVAAALFCASAINPNGLELLRFTITASRLTFNREYVREWQAPSFQTEAAAPLLCTLLLSLALLLFVPRCRPDLVGRLLLLGGTLAVLQTQQFYPFYAAACAPVVAGMADRVAGRAIPVRLTLLSGAAMAGLLLPSLIAALSTLLRSDACESVLASRYPVAAAAFIEQHQLAGPIWNEYAWGGYLIQRLPELPVFVDGRSEVYGDAFLQRYAAVAQGSEAPDGLFDQYGIKLALMPPGIALATELRQDPSWAKIFEDGTAALFMRTA